MSLDPNRIGRVIWEVIPARVGRRFPFLGTALRDGDYLAAGTETAVLFPIAALGLGLVLGFAHPGYFFSESIVVLALLAIPAGLGAALGVWTWIGFVLADVLLHPGQLGPVPQQSLVASITKVYVPAMVVYAVLAGLLIVVPIVAMSVGERLGRGGSRSGLIGGHLLAMVVQCALVFSWAQAAAYLIRPPWSYSGAVPGVPMIASLQRQWWILAAVTAVAVLVRLLLTLRAAARGSQQEAAAVPEAQPPAKPRPWFVNVPLKAVLFTFLFSGVLANLGEGLLFAAVLAAAFLLQDVALPRLGPYASAMGKLPIVVRIVPVVGVGLLLGAAVVEPAVASGEISLRPMAIVILGAMVASALLFPGERPERERQT